MIFKRDKDPLNIFNHFFKNEASGGVVLMIFAIVAIFIANAPSLSHLHNIWHQKLSFSFADYKIEMDLIHWINDGLMAIFFFLVGMEIKREVMSGELSSLKQASLPIFGAIGGMLLPALIYIYFNNGNSAQNGWGIPMATDIAFSIGVITLLGKRVPLQLKVFLTALAIVDDLGAIIVLAVFYPTHSPDFTLLMIAAVIIFIAFLANRARLSSPVVYLILGIVLWFIILFSGIHATLAGVIMAMFIPFSTKKGEKSLMTKLEHTIHPWVTFLILPVFALSNAGVQINATSFTGEISSLANGIFFGLVLGKPLGILGLTILAYKLKLAELPKGVSWSQIASIGIIAGIGFTMSIFIDNLAFYDQKLIDSGKTAILFASFTAAIIGITALYITTDTKKTRISKTNKTN